MEIVGAEAVCILSHIDSDLVEEGKEVDIVYLDISKTLDTVSEKFLIETVDVQAGGEDSKASENRLNNSIPWAVVSSTKRPVTNGVPQDQERV